MLLDLYGLNTPASDMDYKGVILPTAKEILMGKADFERDFSTGDKHSKNTADDIDDKYFSLQKFLREAMKGETWAIDMLHAEGDNLLIESSIWRELVNNRNLFYTKNMKAYVGYVRKQAAKYGVKGSRMGVVEDALNVVNKFAEMGDNADNVSLGAIRDRLPLGEHSRFVIMSHDKIGDQEFYEIVGRKFQMTNKLSYVSDNLGKIYDSYGARAKQAKDNEGIDWKAISHALRAGYQARAIFAQGDFEYPLWETDYILKVKTGQLDFVSEVQPVLEELVAEVDRLAEASDLPEAVDKDFWEGWLCDIHESIVKGEL